jgi:squalene-associated FAD-dependent desaturase
VAVVGTGLAGLAATLELKRRGCSVVLLERSRLLGGKTTSFYVGDTEVDCGQHVILGCYTAFLDFAAELGMRGSLRLQPRFEAVVISATGKSRLRAMNLPAPLHLALPFLGFRALSLRGRMGVARALLSARLRRQPDREEAETFAAWLHRHKQGESALTGFWEPFIVPALNAPLDEASAAAGLFVVRTAFLGDRHAACIGYATVPLVRFAEAAALRCDEVRMRSAVTGLQIEGGRLRGVLVGAEEVEADGAVFAVPPERLRRLPGAEALGVAGLEGFRTQPIVDVHLWYDREVPGLDFAALPGSPVQWVFTRGPGYLCCSMSSAAEWVGTPEDTLVELADREIRARLTELAGAELRRGVVTRDPEATFVPTPGLHRPGSSTLVPNAAIAGAWTDTGWPATMEGAVLSGQAAARSVMDGMGTAGATADGVPGRPAVASHGAHSARPVGEAVLHG